MKNRKLRIILAYLISIMPMNKLRVSLYRKIFGYRIRNSQVGWKTLIVVEKADLTECKISRNNKFIGPMNISIKSGAKIGKNNSFSCGWWAQEEQFKTANYDRHLNIGENTLITSNHYFDVVGSFILGKTSWIAGCASQFWTHGAGVSKRNIYIGEHCYIGSAVKFAPGSSVGNNSIVGLGSVLTQEYYNENVIIAGQPAKILKENYDWKTQKNIY